MASSSFLVGIGELVRLMKIPKFPISRHYHYHPAALFLARRSWSWRMIRISMNTVIVGDMNDEKQRRRLFFVFARRWCRSMLHPLTVFSLSSASSCLRGGSTAATE